MLKENALETLFKHYTSEIKIMSLEYYECFEMI